MNGIIDFPSPEEKQRAILMALQGGAHLTVQDMLRIGRTTEGRKVISRLRQKGHNIIGRKEGGNDFKTYYLAAN
jgi:transposase-like protein